MDREIVLSALISFGFFLIVHIVVFRRMDPKKVLTGIVGTCIVGSVFPLLFAFLFSIIFPVDIYTNWQHFIIVSIVSFILYSFLAICYILGLFGLLESSLRIRILDEIHKSGGEGIKNKDLYKIYNRKLIIQKRLNRFVTSRDMVFDHGYYTFRNRFSYFIIHSFFFQMIKKLYRQ